MDRATVKQILREGLIEAITWLGAQQLTDIDAWLSEDDQ